MSTTMGRVALWALTSVVRSQLNTFLILRRSGWQSLGTSLEHCLCTFRPQSKRARWRERERLGASDNTAIRAGLGQKVCKGFPEPLIRLSGFTVQKVDNSQPGWGSCYASSHAEHGALELPSWERRSLKEQYLHFCWSESLQSKKLVMKKKKKTRLDKKRGGMKRKPQKVAPVARRLMIRTFASGLSAWKMSQQQTLCLGRGKPSPLMCKHNQECLGFSWIFWSQDFHTADCIFIYIQLWCFICLTSSDLHFMAIFFFLTSSVFGWANTTNHKKHLELITL